MGELYKDFFKTLQLTLIKSKYKLISILLDVILKQMIFKSVR